MVGISLENDDDVRCMIEHSERQALIAQVNEEINVKHPIYYDAFDLCERYHDKALGSFNVEMLKSICRHFEIQVMSRDRKKDLVDKLSGMIAECDCVTICSL